MGMYLRNTASSNFPSLAKAFPLAKTSSAVLEWCSAGPFGGTTAQEEKWRGMELILIIIYRQSNQTALLADRLFGDIGDAD